MFARKRSQQSPCESAAAAGKVGKEGGSLRYIVFYINFVKFTFLSF